MVPRILVFSSAGSLRRCLARGLGVNICPLAAVEPELVRGELVRLAWTGDPLETCVLMIWHADKWCSPILERFMDAARHVMEST